MSQKLIFLGVCAMSGVEHDREGCSCSAFGAMALRNVRSCSREMGRPAADSGRKLPSNREFETSF
jgi:hypothetical protein